MPNRQLGEELCKPIIRKFEKQKVYSSSKDNIWGTDLADMQLISKFSKGFHFFYALLIFIENMNGYLKGKRGVTITNAFEKNLYDSNRKPNKIRVEKGSEF